MILVKALTANSWILSDSKTQKTIGLAQSRDGIFGLLGQHLKYSSLEDLVDSEFNDEIVNEQTLEIENPVTELNGFPVKHASASNHNSQKAKDVVIETYCMNPSSKKVLAAGWYGLKFKNGIVASFCPKFQTLLDNDFIGPFSSELDLKFAMQTTASKGTNL